VTRITVGSEGHHAAVHRDEHAEAPDSNQIVTTKAELKGSDAYPFCPQDSSHTGCPEAAGELDDIQQLSHRT